MRLIIVSNRAPVNIIKDETGSIRFEESPGGLASGLRAYVEQLKKNKNSKFEIIWIGWPGAAVEDEERIKKEIALKYGTHSVFLPPETMEKFYEGFCNKTIWPLFHYFPVYTVYEKEYWETYISVNKIFCNALFEVLKPGDIVWVHDYHLMLLPAMIKEKKPDTTVGFFLHIPFPSYEIFRLLPGEWRKEILKGLYNADLVGFHTHDYVTYFLNSVLRILGMPSKMGEVFYNSHLSKADSFPMGIDYDKYHSAALKPEVKMEKQRLRNINQNSKIILSIDRQDYSKGILNRLKGYEYFLQNNPQWQKKVVLMMVVVPSRIGVESYQSIKSKIDELVGNINGRFGNMEWVPIVYQYRSLSFTELIALYSASDIALVTPLRDGMNLIAKEYIASRTDGKGVLILSEMAGAVDELSEAIIINPNNTEEIASAMLHALEMEPREQHRRIFAMQRRLTVYDVFKWAGDFIDMLQDVKKKQMRLKANMLDDMHREKIVALFRNAASRILFLDYDGTLSPYKNHPPDAYPSKELTRLMLKMCSIKNTEVVIISGRDRQTLDKWFGKWPVHLVAEHGVFLKEFGHNWHLIKPIRKNWKKKIYPILIQYTERLPGSFVEEKEYSLVFHYRGSDYSYAEFRTRQLAEHLATYISNMDVQLSRGSFVLEVKNAGVDKGIAAMHWLGHHKINNRFVFAAGDDWTDEDLFRVMPENAISVKVGIKPSYAKYNIVTSEEMIQMLTEFVK